jgi:diguanylate cyclase (GGDEF)-like protein
MAKARHPPLGLLPAYPGRDKGFWGRLRRDLRIWWREENRGLRGSRLAPSLVGGALLVVGLVLAAAADLRVASFERVRNSRLRETAAVLTASLTSLERTAADWAHWTSLYEWVGGSNPSFVATDLESSPLFEEGGILLWFSLDGRRGEAFGPLGPNHPSYASLLDCALSAIHHQPSMHSRQPLLCRGAGGQLYLGVATSISDSRERAPIRGTLVMLQPLLKPAADPLFNTPLQRLVGTMRRVPFWGAATGADRPPAAPVTVLRAEAVAPRAAKGEVLEPLGLRGPLKTAGGESIALRRESWLPVVLQGLVRDGVLALGLLGLVAAGRALLLGERRRQRLQQRLMEQASNRRIRRTGQDLDRLLERIGMIDPNRASDERVLARLIHSPTDPRLNPEQLRSVPVEVKLERLADQLQHFLERAKSLALLDPLTQLPNRRYFIEQVQLQVEASRQGDDKYAILFVDVDKFKNINDSYGHAVGDAALVLVANRLRALIRPGDFLGRYGGDEFAILMQLGHHGNGGLSSLRAKLYEDASRIAGQFGSLVNLDGIHFDLTISVGISLIDPHNPETGAAMRRADIAMYRAKRNSDARIAVFDATDNESYLDSYGLYVDLMQAMRDSCFEVVFQPVVDREGRIAAVEALSRWNHPRLGDVSPDVFLELAERYRQINLLSNDLIARALEAFVPLYRQRPLLRLAINVPSSKLCDPLFPRQLDQLLEGHGLSPERLTIEITERSPLVVDANLKANLRSLKQRGIAISLDDFGTGYSSLSLLTLLQPDEVKIDRSFVVAMQEDPLAFQIVGLMADMVQRMDLQVVAEGVEDASVWDQLLTLHIPFFQGFYFSEPLSAQVLECSQIWADVAPPSPAPAAIGKDGEDRFSPGLP